MSRLTIKNFGPLKSVSIPLSRIMVFMGPQSSGKSTVAKIISFCLWLEKDIIFHQSVKHVDEDFMAKYFIDYHFFGNYKNDDWEISYESEVLSLCYNASGVTCRKGREWSKGSLSKNAYIPAERNCVSVTGLKSLEMDANYQRSFVFDWLDMLDKCTGDRALDLQKTLGLGMKVYYDSELKRLVARPEGVEKDFDMPELSSGLQSIIPLILTFENLTKWVFDSLESLSYEKSDELPRSLAKNFIGEHGPDGMDEAEIIAGIGNDSFERLVKSMKVIMSLKNNNGLDADIKKIVDVRDKISRPHFSNIVIEEPDQNIFPRTQIDLVYYLLAEINRAGDRIGHFVITTHSPFILYAVNNCMLGHTVRAALPESEKASLFADSWIDPAQTAIYELKDGKFLSNDGKEDATIQAADGLIRKNYFDGIMGELMADFRKLLVYYPD